MVTVIDRPITTVKPRRLPDTFKVKVTNEDIQLGIRGSVNQCPIARATHRYLFLEHNIASTIDDNVSVVGPTTINGRSYEIRRRDFAAIVLYDITGIMWPRTVKFTKTIR